MDRLERVDSPTDSLIVAMEGHQSRVWTALPGIVLSFDPTEVTCKVQLAVQMQVQAPDGSFSWVSVAPLIHCPVVFPQGGGLLMTMPIKAGDECLVVFASRCIDGWWATGQVSPQVELRMHDLSDGFVIPGVRNSQRPITAFNSSAAEIRNESGSLKVSVDGTTNKITLKAVEIDVIGNLQVTGNVGVTGSMTNNGTNIGDTHTHGNVQNGPNRTGGPG